MTTHPSFAFKNHGKTPATIRHVHAAAGVFKDFINVDMPNLDRPAVVLGMGTPARIIVGSGNKSQDILCPVMILRVDWPEGGNQPANAYFYGKIEYDDVFNKRRVEPFFFYYFPATGHFLHVDHVDLAARYIWATHSDHA